jgi:predicted dehydrogenase
MPDSLGVAVIGAGMAGRAHMAAYQTAASLYESVLPEVRLVSIGDVNEGFGSSAARRFGFQRNDTDWRAIAAADDIDVVSVVVANALHREIVDGLAAAGKHVLCEKPLSDTLDDARAMAATAHKSSSLLRIGFTYRRSPAIAYARHLVQSGRLGRVLHFSGKYFCDYSADPAVPISWRYKGGPGSGALADVGSHLSYVSEFICGDITSVRGGQLSTVITERPKPLGAIAGRGQVEVSDETDMVENDDYAAFSATFDRGGVGNFEVSRVAAGLPNGLRFEIYCENGALTFDQHRPSEIGLFLSEGDAAERGYRQVFLGSSHPYVAGGMPIDVGGVGFGQNEYFAFQARAFLEEVANIDASTALPPCATFDEGVHNMEVLAAVAESAAAGGTTVELQSESKVSA